MNKFHAPLRSTSTSSRWLPILDGRRDSVVVQMACPTMYRARVMSPGIFRYSIGASRSSGFSLSIEQHTVGNLRGFPSRRFAVTVCVLIRNECV